MGPQAKLVIIDNGDCGRFDDNDDDDDNAKGMLKYVGSCHNGDDFEGGGSPCIISLSVVSVSHEK